MNLDCHYPSSALARAKHVVNRERTRSSLEPLEDRVVLSTIFVVPANASIDATHKHTVQEAITVAVAGDTVLLQPGISSAAGTISVNVANLTIAGDHVLPAQILPLLD